MKEKLLITRIEAALKKREYAYRLIEEADAELAKCTAELKREEEKNAGGGT